MQEFWSHDHKGSFDMGIIIPGRQIVASLKLFAVFGEATEVGSSFSCVGGWTSGRVGFVF